MKWSDYKLLYKKHLKEEKKKKFLSFIGEVKDKRIVEILRGKLVNSFVEGEAKRVDLICEEEAAYLDDISDKVGITSIGVEKGLRSFPPYSFDYAVCLGTINFWFTDKHIEIVHDLLDRNGEFIFDSIDFKPSLVPLVEIYQLEDKSYLEAKWLAGETIYHIQVCEGMPPNIDTYPWISSEGFLEVLNKYFKVEIYKDESGKIYKCMKK